MQQDSNNQYEETGSSRSSSISRTERNSTAPNDLPDSREDSKKLQPEETTIDLPDVKDIPGQEFVHAPPLGELGDTTISSDDEEGTRIFDEETDDLLEDADSNVSATEKRTLENADFIPSSDEISLRRATMDNVDFQGEKLNERSFGEDRSGRDLDIPGSELDDRNEGMGEEDEENNAYSLNNDREN
jgi:hypothetical protein